VLIRPEAPTDRAAISGVIERAFAGHLHGNGTEQLIVDALRSSGALSLSLVAERDGPILGHIAFSPVSSGTWARVSGAAAGELHGACVRRRTAGGRGYVPFRIRR
jgi:predicted N-acetyltransferase YhbS